VEKCTIKLEYSDITECVEITQYGFCSGRTKDYYKFKIGTKVYQILLTIIAVINANKNRKLTIFTRSKQVDKLLKNQIKKSKYHNLIDKIKEHKDVVIRIE